MVGIIAGALAWRQGNTSDAHDDCSIARSLIDYNKAQNEKLRAAIDPDAGSQPSIDAYQAWAQQIRAYSTQIHRPDLVRHGQELADDAQQFVGLVQEIHSNHSVPAHPGEPPPGIQRYAYLTKQFHDNLAALDTACPKA